MNRLIIAEKPSVALRLAMALSELQPKRLNVNGVGYFEIVRGNDKLYIVAAAGHLFSLHQKGVSRKLPIFDIEWIASHKVNQTAYFTKKYLDVVEEIGRRCTFFINACDFDLEGSVIGSNLIKMVVNKDANSSLSGRNDLGRMHFSTTTTPDLVNAYDNLSPFDFTNFDAGEARHELDWMWGINMSRALMGALYSSGGKKVMSIGRVQGPTLGLLAKRELEIKNFVSAPFWNLFAKIADIEFANKKGNIEDKQTAEKALESTKAGEAVVSGFDEKDELHAPFPPFDLTSLQLEANRVFRIDPSRTLKIAQTLYERSYISYPRTSSQKLPPSLNLRKVISDLAKNATYATLANNLIASGRFKPHEGMKSDEAHPAIYPTGEKPTKLGPEEEKVYDLIAKRFLACFAPWSKGQRRSITVSAGGEEYFASGEVIGEKGWLDFYAPYYKPKELALPKMEKGSKVKIEEAYMKEGKTEPPKRYSKAGLISLLEKKQLGTKATRAAIIDTLYDRGYVQNARMEITDFGMSVYDALSKYCPEILNEEMTKKLDDDLERVSKGEIKKVQLVDEGKKILVEIIQKFDDHKTEIGKELLKGLHESEKSSAIGKCPKCGGDLAVKRSRIGKQFVGCSTWPKCNNGYPLPQYAKIVPINKICDKCKTPKVKVFAKGKVYEMCLDPNCETKKEWGKKEDTAKPGSEDAPQTTKPKVKRVRKKPIKKSVQEE